MDAPNTVSFTALARMRWKLEDPRIQLNGFASKLREMIINTEEDAGIIEVTFKYKFNPDAYYIDEEKREIVLYRVEEAGPLTVKNIYDLRKIHDYLQGVNWKMRLYVFDRYCTEHKEIELVKFRFDLLEKEAANLAEVAPMRVPPILS